MKFQRLEEVQVNKPNCQPDAMEIQISNFFILFKLFKEFVFYFSICEISISKYIKLIRIISQIDDQKICIHYFTSFLLYLNKKR